MRLPAGLGVLCLALCCLGGARELWSGDHEWKKLIMVHHWPMTVCNEVANNCEHPPDYWTIHGLWPDKSGECNRSWPFNPDEIKGLLPDMRLYWPDVLHSSPNHSVHFWRHEWEKHGTCAAQLDALNSQRKYFGKTLDLYKELALNSTLQKLGIKPSISYYQRFQILSMPWSVCTEWCPKSSVFHPNRSLYSSCQAGTGKALGGDHSCPSGALAPVQRQRKGLASGAWIRGREGADPRADRAVPDQGPAASGLSRTRGAGAPEAGSRARRDPDPGAGDL
uniref:Ribonuclease T2 n=1 Tax=Sus scrofa TaxID=9823 RepID=A0A8D0XZX3_PIG